MKSLDIVFLCASVLMIAGLKSGGLTSAVGGEPVVGRQTKPITLIGCRIKLIEEVTLASARPGILAFVEPDEGDTVRAQQQVAGLHDEVATAALAIAAQQAKNDVGVRYAKKAAEVAKAVHQKSIEANRLARRSIPAIEVERLRLAAEKSVLEIEQAEHQLDVNRLARAEKQAELKAYRILAPFDGIVTRVYKSTGEAVRQGDPILQVVNPSRVRIEGYVKINDFWNVKPGDPVKVQLDIDNVELEVEKQTFKGRIVFVDVKVKLSKVRVWAEVENRDNVLRAGLRARMTIFPNRRASNKTASKSEN